MLIECTRIKSCFKKFIAAFVISLIMPLSFASFDSHLPYPLSCPYTQSLYFNTAFLSQSSLVAETLTTHEGFQEVQFPSADGIALRGLYKEVANAQATIIFAAGFFPGRKEGIATFITMVPPSCNMLFFDARGHGQSDGPFWSTIPCYGLHEYQDILGALSWVHEKTQKPIFLHGLCAGAFHSIKAIHALMHANTFDSFQIKGIILDSSITDTPTACIIPLIHIREKMLPVWWLRVFGNDTKQSVKERWFYKMSWYCAAAALYPLYWIIKNTLTTYGQELTIESILPTISCPTLIIHARQDSYSPFAHIEKIIPQLVNAQLCILDDTDHAVLHLKHSQAYKNAFMGFVERQLSSCSSSLSL